jgi:hypothetical protein
MVDGDVDSAEAVTHTRNAELQSDGTTIIKQVLERLDSNTSRSTVGQIQMDPLPPVDDYNNDPMENMPASPPLPPGPKKGRVSADIIPLHIYVKFP